MNIDIIGMPIYYGCDVEGTNLVYDYLKKRDKNFKIKKHNLFDNGKIFVNENSVKHLNDVKMKYLESIMESSKLLYNVVKGSLNHGNFPIIIGGDHAAAIGSVSSIIDYFNNDVTVIWVDSHTDIHTEKSSPSGNIHGIPLAICMKECDNRFSIGNLALPKENLIYFGISNNEEAERNFIKNNNIKMYSYEYIKNIGIANAIKDLLKSVKTKYVHISFDFDSLNPNLFGAVNVAKEKKYLSNVGFSLEEGTYILRELLTNLNVCSMDLAEYNPLLDKNNDVEYVEKVLETIDEFLK